MGTIPKPDKRELSDHLCECGCGKFTFIAHYNPGKGQVKPGTPLRFLAGHYVRNEGRPKWIEEDTGYKTPCLIWQFSTDGGGYGHTWDQDSKRYARAHRLAYEKNVGPIPYAYEIDHLCGQKLCVNPDHLEAVTKAENLWRGLMFKAGLTPTQLTSLREWMTENLTEEQLASLWSDYCVG